MPSRSLAITLLTVCLAGAAARGDALDGEPGRARAHTRVRVDAAHLTLSDHDGRLDCAGVGVPCDPGTPPAALTLAWDPAAVHPTLAHGPFVAYLRDGETIASMRPVLARVLRKARRAGRHLGATVELERTRAIERSSEGSCQVTTTEVITVRLRGTSLPPFESRAVESSGWGPGLCP